MKMRACWTILLFAFVLSGGCLSTIEALPAAEASPGDAAATSPSDREIRALTEFVENNTTKFALIRLGVRAVEPLMDKLDDGNEGVVLAAQITLRWIADDASKSPQRQSVMTKELAAIARSARPLDQRLFAVQMLGKVRGDEAANALTAFMQKEELQLTAVDSLRTIPGTAATNVLAAAFEKGGSVKMRCALLTALGTRRDPQVTPLLIEQTNNSDRMVRLTAVRALGECGDRAAAGPLLDLAAGKGERSDDSVRQTAVNACNRMGDACVKDGNVEQAIKMYETALARANNDNSRVAALERLGRTGSPAVVVTLEKWMKGGPGKVTSAACAAYLNVADAAMNAKKSDEALALYYKVIDSDSSSSFHVARALLRCGDLKNPGSFTRMAAFLKVDEKRFEKNGGLTNLQRYELWNAAVYGLRQIATPEATDALAVALGQSSADSLKQLVILDALTAHHDRRTIAAVAPLAANAEGEVKLRAIRVLGQIGGEAAEETLAGLLKAKPADAMDAILLAYVDLGSGYMADNDIPRALGAFHAVIQTGGNEEAMVGALKRVATLGDKTSMAFVTPLLEKGEGMVLIGAGEAAAAIADRLAAAGERDEAVRLYTMVQASGAAAQVDVRNRLRNVGEQADILARDGVIDAWWIIGPFAAKSSEEWEKSLFPESEIALKKQYEAEGRKLSWLPVRTKSGTDSIRLDLILKPNKYVAAYAYAVIVTRREEDAVLKINHDKDGFVCWINGSKVATAMVDGKPEGPQEAAVHLQKGENAILLKTRQFDGTWQFDVRLVDSAGETLKFNIR